MVIHALVHLPTGECLEAGYTDMSRPILSQGPPTIYDLNYDVVVVLRIPDPRTEKWNGTTLVAKSAQEIADYDNAAKNTRALGINDDALIQAVAMLDFEERQKLTLKVGQTLLTAPEYRARIRAIYRSLL